MAAPSLSPAAGCGVVSSAVEIVSNADLSLPERMCA
jgi:hypothetical protein